MRIAYLCNSYPAVSHSFVRREIEGVEEAGHEIHRFSIRPHRNLKDEADIREAAITEVVLGQGLFRLTATTLLYALTRPTAALRAFGVAMHLSSPGLKAQFRHAAYWIEAGWLARRFAQLCIEHVHAHFGTNPAAVATIARAWGAPPFSFTVHGPDEFDAPQELALSQKMAAASFVVAISSFGRSQLMRWTPSEQWDKIHVVRCGLDRSFLAAVPQPINATSTEFVCVARLSTQKGIPLLIAACDQLRREGSLFSLTIVGDGEMRGEVEADVARRGLENVVTFAGAQPSEEIRHFLRGARAFVLPSFAEGLPVVLMEALAMCRPVITTAIAGIPELVDQECGWLIPPGSEESLTKAMFEALTASPTDLSDKAVVGRARVRKLHDARKNAARLSQLAQGLSRKESPLGG